MDRNALFNELFKRNFPKMCERPGLYPFRDEIKEICRKVFFEENLYIMPWDKQL
jgi:hypothetical protein